MNIQTLKAEFAQKCALQRDLQYKIDEISTEVVSTRGAVSNQTLDRLNQLELGLEDVENQIQTMKLNLSKRGITNSEIKEIEIPAASPATSFSFPVTPTSQDPATNELIASIENEKYHQQHINEVNAWNQAEKLRQEKIREQNLKLLQMHEQLQQMKIAEEENIQKQKKIVQAEQEALREREIMLNEEQKSQVALIDAKLAQLRALEQNLAGNQQQLSSGQQRALQALQEQRKHILSNGELVSMDRECSSNDKVYSQQVNTNGNVPPAYGSMQPPTGNSYQGSTANQAYGTAQAPAVPQNFFQAPQYASMAPGQGHAYNGNSSAPSKYPNAPQGFGSAVAGANPEIQLWKQEEASLQDWQSRSTSMEQQHQQQLEKEEQELVKRLQQQEEQMRSQWKEELSHNQADLAQLQNQITDDALCRMSEAELRLYLEHTQKNQYIDDMLERRQSLLEQQAWLLQQDLENKTMALSFREDDLKAKEWQIEQEREAEMRALARVFCIVIETTNPEGKRTGKTYQMQVRAGDSLYRICARIPHDKELFCVRLDYNGTLLDELDKNLLELQIPDNAFMISRLTPKADVDVLNLIPCEDCGKRFQAEVFGAHKCMKKYSQELPSERKKKAAPAPRKAAAPVTRTVYAKPTVQRNEVIPCEYCEGLFPLNRIRSHQQDCSDRKRRRDPVPRVTRYNYY